jgi:hypothetical protein
MKPWHLPTWDSLASKLGDFAVKHVDAELFLLKCHLLIEALMYSFLAQRLGIEEQHLPVLQYFPLVKLAFGGKEHADSLANVLAINDLRNALAHEMEAEALNIEYAKFAAKMQVYWPSSASSSRTDVIEKVRSAAVRAACFICVVNAWCDVAARYVGSIGADPAAVEKFRFSLDGPRRKVEELRQTQMQCGQF